MAVVLDSKDLALIDQEFAAESQVWEVLRAGAKDISESDFVGAHEVRINKMTGFTAADYKRNQDNTRSSVSVSKETHKLTQERWMAYDLDTLDEDENAALTVQNVITQHTRLVTIPEKDKYAVKQLFARAQAAGSSAGNIVDETITSANALSAYDAAEKYMTDNEVIGPFVMLVSSDYYLALKNASGVSKTFTVTEKNISGINRRVAMLDNDIPIVQVAKSRLQVVTGYTVNFILVPLNVAAPIEKYNSIDLVPASSDRNGYRDTVKGLDYYDIIVFDNAAKAIYVSAIKATTPSGT